MRRKGKRKRRASGKFGFQQGNKLQGPVYGQPVEPIVYRRLTQDEYNLVVNDPDAGIARGSNGAECSVKFLRPSAARQSRLQAAAASAASETEEKQTMRFLQLSKIEDIWNQATAGHHYHQPTCKGHLAFDMSAERKFGTCWKEQLHCEDCGFKSGRYKLYREGQRTGKRGPRPAAPNVTLSAGVTHTGIGATGARKIIMSMGSPAPSVSLQRTVSSVGEQLVQINQEDLGRQREMLKRVNRARNLPEDAGVACRRGKSADIIFIM